MSDKPKQEYNDLRAVSPDAVSRFAGEYWRLCEDHGLMLDTRTDADGYSELDLGLYCPAEMEAFDVALLKVHKRNVESINYAEAARARNDDVAKIASQISSIELTIKSVVEAVDRMAQRLDNMEEVASES